LCRSKRKWTYFYLYVILDVFSRYVTGWMVAMRESAELAKRLIEESCRKQCIQPGQLTRHADRGISMSSKPVAFLLADLGVTKTHSRPHVSNDNPYSESQFRTLKYRPEFPDRFGCIQDSRAFCQGFFRWYNGEHRHSSPGLLTPAMVHYNQTDQVLQQRQQVLDAAYQLHPERFVRSAPRPPAVPTEAWINKPVQLSGAASLVNDSVVKGLSKTKSYEGDANRERVLRCEAIEPRLRKLARLRCGRWEYAIAERR
jgi:putative transposase